MVKEPLLEVLKKYRKGIMMGIFFCALNSSSFYLLTVNIPTYFGSLLGASYSDNLLITSVLLVLITVLLPFFGKLADKYNNKKMILYSVGASILLLYPLSVAITANSIVLLSITMLLFALLFTCISALLPFFLSELFPTHVRFTCVSVSFNIVDTIFGGFTPVVVLYLTRLTGNPAAFCWLLLFCGLISFVAFVEMKERHKIEE